MVIKLNCSTFFFSQSTCLMLNELFKNNYGQQIKKKKKRAGEPKSKRQVKLNIHRLFPLGVRDGQEIFTATFPVRE